MLKAFSTNGRPPLTRNPAKAPRHQDPSRPDGRGEGTHDWVVDGLAQQVGLGALLGPLCVQHTQVDIAQLQDTGSGAGVSS